ncbi:hypothetical protein [Croceimicrobium sp.]|uniref:hypothetical protein n=1 Tax=Croceimicrobium sp. TaxID=2828340 RepID=UPI003BAA3F51
MGENQIEWCQIENTDIICRSILLPGDFKEEDQLLKIPTTLIIPSIKEHNRKSCIRVSCCGVDEAKKTILKTAQRKRYCGFAFIKVGRLIDTWEKCLAEKKEKNKGLPNIKLKVQSTPIFFHSNIYLKNGCANYLFCKLPLIRTIS